MMKDVHGDKQHKLINKENITIYVFIHSGRMVFVRRYGTPMKNMITGVVIKAKVVIVSYGNLPVVQDFVINEETDMFHKLVLQNWKIYFVPIKIYHFDSFSNPYTTPGNSLLCIHYINIYFVVINEFVPLFLIKQYLIAG